MGKAALQTADSLRAALRVRFGAAVDAEVRARPADGRPIPSGWTRVDESLDGGLRPGETALVSGGPGAGSLALASGWAREHVLRREPVLVLDPLATSLAHAWIEPEGAEAPIWRLGVGAAFGTERELWPALDIALRSGAFGLLVLLEPPPAPRALAARVARLAREQRARLVVTDSTLDPGDLETRAGGAAPWPPTYRVQLSAGLVRWVEGPLGAAPERRALRGRVEARDGRTDGFEREVDAGAQTDRVCAPAPAPDRRPPSGRGGRRRRSR